MKHSGLIGGHSHTSLQRSRSYTGCRSSTCHHQNCYSCIRLSTVVAISRTSLTLSCLLRPTRMYANFVPPLLEPLPSNEAGAAACRTQFGRRCLLSGRHRHMEQSPRHYPYHRLPPSLPSCAQDTSVPLSI